MITLKKKRNFDLSKNEEKTYYVLGQYLNEQGIAYSTVVLFGTLQQAYDKLSECVDTDYSSWYSVPTTITHEEVVAMYNGGDVWNQVYVILG